MEQVIASSLNEYIDAVLSFKLNPDETIFFRGEPDDFQETAFQPSIYRNSIIKNEHKLYRDIQRFNDAEFSSDRSTLDRLSRMQHYRTPTRLTDLSEDALTALFFALLHEADAKNIKPIVYVVAIKNDEIKYYDSDAVSVVSNLAKSPIINNDNIYKSKTTLARDALKAIEDKEVNPFQSFNEKESVKYLLHDIKEDKGYFEGKVNPNHIFSIFCVKPKLSNSRLNGQKGAFLVYGLNKSDITKSPSFIKRVGNYCFLDEIKSINHPVARIKKITIGDRINISDINKLGITMPYIYTGLEKIADHFKKIYG
ncbi:FRG domain-containing protein [Aeromonas sp. R2-2]|uniref:FRG domain-containing protein n=1 Tax=Aeromonas sp. R2-2 TaxID=3138460 RepID=UPI0034A21056